MKQPGAICPTKRRLLTAYQTATKLYSNAVADLSVLIGKTSREDYDKLNLAAQKARRSSANALEALEAHTDDHSC